MEVGSFDVDLTKFSFYACALQHMLFDSEAQSNGA
jgi:hypothetical protein